MTYRIIEQEDHSPKREFVSEQIIREPKNRVVRSGKKPRGTGRIFKNGGVEFKILSIDRGLSDTGPPYIDNLKIKFSVANLPEEAITLNSPRLITTSLWKPDELERHTDDYFWIEDAKGDLGWRRLNFGQNLDSNNWTLNGDEKKEFTATYSLKSTDSVIMKKATNKKINGPRNLTLLFVNGPGWRVKDTKTLPLEYFWVGPFYE